MTGADIVRLRLVNQLLVDTRASTPAEVVSRLGAVQAQDYLGALWAVGLRCGAASQADVERALAERSVVRTWPMRGTLHFVAAEDVRWMLALLAPRVVARAAGRHRQLGLDDAVFARAEAAVVRALEGGGRLTRSAVYEVLARTGVATDQSRGLHILGWLAQRGVICFGARDGKQQTFVLLDEWVAPARPVSREWALAEIARRYFAGHGPATLRDFVWWTGLTISDSRTAIAQVESELERATSDSETYWFAAPERRRPRPSAHLLPVYDEYTVAYRNRSAILDPSHAARAKNGIFSPVVVANGRIVGTWRRSRSKDGVTVATSLFVPLDAAATRLLGSATARYATFASAGAVAS